MVGFLDDVRHVSDQNGGLRCSWRGGWSIGGAGWACRLGAWLPLAWGLLPFIAATVGVGLGLVLPMRQMVARWRLLAQGGRMLPNVPARHCPFSGAGGFREYGITGHHPLSDIIEAKFVLTWRKPCRVMCVSENQE